MENGNLENVVENERFISSAPLKDVPDDWLFITVLVRQFYIPMSKFRSCLDGKPHKNENGVKKVLFS